LTGGGPVSSCEGRSWRVASLYASLLQATCGVVSSALCPHSHCWSHQGWKRSTGNTGNTSDSWHGASACVFSWTLRCYRDEKRCFVVVVLSDSMLFPGGRVDMVNSLLARTARIIYNLTLQVCAAGCFCRNSVLTISFCSYYY